MPGAGRRLALRRPHRLRQRELRRRHRPVQGRLPAGRGLRHRRVQRPRPVHRPPAGRLGLRCQQRLRERRLQLPGLRGRQLGATGQPLHHGQRVPERHLHCRLLRRLLRRPRLRPRARRRDLLPGRLPGRLRQVSGRHAGLRRRRRLRRRPVRGRGVPERRGAEPGRSLPLLPRMQERHLLRRLLPGQLRRRLLHGRSQRRDLLLVQRGLQQVPERHAGLHLRLPVRQRHLRARILRGLLQAVHGGMLAGHRVLLGQLRSGHPGQPELRALAAGARCAGGIGWRLRESCGPAGGVPSTRSTQMVG